MRRLSISAAHAFLLVFAVDDHASFTEVRQLWDQIGEQRTNREEIPCVIVANKVWERRGKEANVFTYRPIYEEVMFLVYSGAFGLYISTKLLGQIGSTAWSDQS